MSISAIVFLALFGGTLVLALVRHPMFGLYAYLLAFYGYPPGRWWGADLPDLRWSFLAAIVTLLSTMRMKSNPKNAAWFANPVAGLLIAFTAWLWIQSLWAISPDDHSVLVETYTKYIILFFLMYRILVDEKTVLHFSIAHVIGCAYFGWLAFRTAETGRFEYIGGPNMDGASAFAVQMTTGLIFAGVLLIQTRGYIRLMLLLAIPFILNGIILTQSRGGFLGLVAGGVAVLFLSPVGHRKTFYSASALALVLFGLLAHDVFWERMRTIFDATDRASETIDSSAESRWVLVDAQWEMFKINPVIGIGHRGTATLSPMFLDERWLALQGGRSSHNTWMTVIVEQGLVGAVVYFGLTLWAGMRLLRLKSLTRTLNSNSLGFSNCAIGGALAAILVSGQFADFLRLEITIWCLILLAVISQISANAHSSAPILNARRDIRKRSRSLG